MKALAIFFKSHRTTLLAVWAVVILFGQNAAVVYEHTGHLSMTDLRGVAIALLLGYMRSPRDAKVVTTTLAPTATTITDVKPG